MNINLTLLASALSMLILIISIVELILMYQKKEFKLFFSAIALMIVGGIITSGVVNLNLMIALLLMVPIIIIKVLFYKRHKSDKFVRIVFFLQVAFIVIYFIFIILFLIFINNLGKV